MDHKTHHDLICESPAVESETRQAETLRAYRLRQSMENPNKAIGEVVGDRELTKGEAAMLDAVKVTFRQIAVQDQDADAEAIRQAQALMREVMNRTGARSLFGFVEDIVNGKSSAQGDALIARAKRLHEEFRADDWP